MRSDKPDGDDVFFRLGLKTENLLSLSGHYSSPEEAGALIAGVLLAILAARSGRSLGLLGSEVEGFHGALEPD